MAPPPPATPTPHRFLVPKRSQQSRQETPKAFHSGGQQFQTTPRFSLHSTPRGPPSQHPSSSLHTPAPARTGAGAGSGSGSGAFFRPTPRNTNPINDIVDSSPPFAERQPSGGNRNDYIEIDADADVDIDVDAVPESSPVRGYGSTDHDDSGSSEDEAFRSRSSKRRRISISSDFGTDQNDESLLLLLHEHESGAVGDEDVQDDDDDDDDEDVNMIHSSPAASNDDDDDDERPSAPAHQPTFHKAPRFKPAEVSDVPHRGDPLPDAFSPHRRKGAKYIPGGLAASVRDWFVDVWAGSRTGSKQLSGGGGGSEWIATIRVDEVNAAPGMAFVTGRHVAYEEAEGEGGVAGDGDAGGETASRGARIVLAGSPRLTGLEKRPDVRPGVVVGIGRPTWEVSLPDQGRWAVVCEWAVLR
ncbi:hypothetical protein F4677DRAFT_404361 [Hypoxylon crocopeplum]|nr:hypothetical protein F4677DRAFT_404361 [Hypoxylon crocopeplum]